MSVFIGWLPLTVPKMGVYGTVAAYHIHGTIGCVSPVNNAPDEFLEQVTEDDHQAALQEFREREEITIDTAELAGQ